ncbi:hypothetical protein D3C78_448910 [compost metagenome]
MVVQAEQQLDQLAGTDHLRDQVERHHHQRTGGRQGADLLLPEAVRGHVGEGVLAQVAQAFGDQEEDDRPADQEADRVDQAVVARGEHECGNTQERGGRHVVTGNRQAVLEAGDLATGGVVVRRRLVALGGPVGDAEGEGDEGHEHGDRGDIQRLLLHLAGQGIGGPHGGCEGSAGQYGQGFGVANHCCASFRMALFSSSNSPLARRT